MQPEDLAASQEAPRREDAILNYEKMRRRLVDAADPHFSRRERPQLAGEPER